jgi:DNA polymerase
MGVPPYGWQVGQAAQMAFMEAKLPSVKAKSINRSARGAKMANECPSGKSAAPFLPDRFSLAALIKAADRCRGCPLYCHATQTVFGEGPAHAQVVMVGEQPGDSEDREGRPFVGPAGHLLAEVMERAGLRRKEVYLTNAVKHFKFVQRGKRRVHSKPSAREITACRPWLEAELEVIHPRMLVCMGATAAQSLLGRDFRVSRSRGKVIQSRWAPWTIATLHPSALLRMPTPDARAQAMADFEADLRQVAAELASDPARGQSPGA